MLDYIEKQIEKFSNHKLYVSLACAFAAASCVCLLDYLVSTASEPFKPQQFLTRSLISFSSYVGIALLLHRFWTRKANRIIPAWILIAVLGSLVNVIAGSLGWLPQALSEQSREALWDDLDMLWSVFQVHSLITLPAAGIIYYVGAIVRGIRNWRKGLDFIKGS